MRFAWTAFNGRDTRLGAYAIFVGSWVDKILAYGVSSIAMLVASCYIHVLAKGGSNRKGKSFCVVDIQSRSNKDDTARQSPIHIL